MFYDSSYDSGGIALEANKMSEISKKQMKQILKLEAEIEKIKDEIRSFNADKEYEMMQRMGDSYIPPERLARECEFTIVGDMLICTRCHKEVFMETFFIPPYCPHCYAKHKGKEE